MKAFILAAGFGTRLRPYSEKIPKPLFRVGGQTILDRTIGQLVRAGVDGIIINTHHLHQQIEHHVAETAYPVPVETRYEPAILDTGGGIRNVADFFEGEPFIAVNGDIVTDADYSTIYAFHRAHNHPVTLVLHDYPEFNCVTTDSQDMVRGFYLEDKPGDARPELAFTGIQVVDPGVISLIPPEGPYSSLDLYRTLIGQGPNVKAMVLEHTYWADLGTPDKYLEGCRRLSAPGAFRKAFPDGGADNIQETPLCGDGSDRLYTRLTRGHDSLIVSDHGITLNLPGSEAAAFVRIGSHLRAKGIPVPEIYDDDLFSGQVFLEDLGDVHLETVARAGGRAEKERLYLSVLDILVRMSLKGAKGFDTQWTCQTTHYDRDLIIERECHYFMEAFVNRVLGWDLPVDALDEDFGILAGRALDTGCMGFMHRDFQSRNIMVQGDACRVIDFQGGRLGPVQYDLASLLIDPYAGLDPETRQRFVPCFMEAYGRVCDFDKQDFLESYKHAQITRNLQMLGAFGFLSRVKGKTMFESHIPSAVKTLKHNAAYLDDQYFKALKKIIEKI